MNCPICGSEVKQGTAFCSECGARIVPEYQSETPKPGPVFSQSEDQAGGAQQAPGQEAYTYSQGTGGAYSDNNQGAYTNGAQAQGTYQSADSQYGYSNQSQGDPGTQYGYAGQPQQGWNNGQTPAYSYTDAEGMDLTPVSMWGYLGYLALFTMIPCVSPIITIVFAISNNNIHVRNLARGFWCLASYYLYWRSLEGYCSGQLYTA